MILVYYTNKFVIGMLHFLEACCTAKKITLNAELLQRIFKKNDKMSCILFYFKKSPSKFSILDGLLLEMLKIITYFDTYIPNSAFFPFILTPKARYRLINNLVIFFNFNNNTVKINNHINVI